MEVPKEMINGNFLFVEEEKKIYQMIDGKIQLSGLTENWDLLSLILVDGEKEANRKMMVESDKEVLGDSIFIIYKPREFRSVEMA